MTTQRIPVFIADRNVMSNQLLAESLGRDSRFDVATISPAPRILALPPVKQPGVAVISAELDSGPTKGMHLARVLRLRSLDLSIVILLESLEREKVIASFRSGAKGVFCRTESVSELHTCIERVSQGRIWTGRAEAEYLLEAIQSSPNCDGLGDLSKITRREGEVVELATQGLSNKQIAERLGLSEHTVKNHLFRIFDKLKVASRIELLFLMVKGRGYHSGELALQLLATDKPGMAAVTAAAKDGFVVGQFMLGLAHLQGQDVERDNRAAYYWLRLAELNCSHVLEQSRSRITELESVLHSQDIQELEQQVAEKAQQHEKLMRQACGKFWPEVLSITKLAS
jgi:two-component system, NarL family, nitrate/nitrite response regulator NarL